MSKLAKKPVSIVEGVNIYPASSLADVLELLNTAVVGVLQREPYRVSAEALLAVRASHTASTIPPFPAACQARGLVFYPGNTLSRNPCGTGFVLARLGYIPKQGETVEHEGVRITVLEAEERRILKLRIDLPAPPAAQQA